MKKKFFRGTVFLTSTAVLLIAVLLCLIFYGQFSSKEYTTLQEEAKIFSKLDSTSILPVVNSIKSNEMRITILSSEGDVLFDNAEISDPLTPVEITEALALENTHTRYFSPTLNSDAYSYSVELGDSTVLRTEKKATSFWQMLASAFPTIILVVLFFIIINYFLSKRLAKKVVAPLKKLDLSQGKDPLYDELAPLIRSIMKSQEQIAEDTHELQSRKNTINAIMENMDEGVILLDEKGEVLSINKKITHIFEVTESIEGRNVLELLRDLNFSQNIEKSLQGKRREMLFEKSGHEYRILISPVSETGVVVLFLDITEKSEGERIRREFSANVSHELKTPLTSIHGNIEMLKEGVVKEEDKSLFYDKIMKESSRLIALVDDIILLSELDEGGISEQFTEVNLKDLAVECTAALEQKAKKHEVSINITGESTVWGNYSLLYELFYNLIDNAIKYNHIGGKLDIQLKNDEKEVQITFADNGIGISEENQARIFERFYRADKSRSKKSGGTGLGLAIAKHVALTHNGHIEMNSKLGLGTTFTVFLPKK